jgi:peptidoglycan/xylan/chitin deacetylase (PgdA/CDA1 family)
MRALLCILLALAIAAPAAGQPRGQRFVSIAFHDVVDDPADLASDSVTTRTLVQFFDWMKEAGWTAVSLDDLTGAAKGARTLPDKAILLTFDDGPRSNYTRVFPLLKAYRYPAVFTLVGSWMEDTPDGMVRYGDEKVPRTNFISWDEAREMQASGLVEFASQSYDLHRGVQGDPQGSQTPASVTRIYDPQAGRYEGDDTYRARLRADLSRSIEVMRAQLGRAPRAIAWPYGRYTGSELGIAQELGFSFGLTLEEELAYTSDLRLIPRYAPAGNPQLRDIVASLRFETSGPRTLRIACLTLDSLAGARDTTAQDEALGHLIENVRALGPNIVIIEAAAALPSPQSALGDVYFPTELRPIRNDLLGRATWQLGTRADVDVFLHLPLAAAEAAVGDANVPGLFADMSRYVRADGIVIDLPAEVGSSTMAAGRPEEIRARREGLDPARLDRWTALGLAAFRAAADINPRLHLMVATAAPAGPPDWADIGLLPQGGDARKTEALAARLHKVGWLRPGSAGRVALSLPADPAEQLDALQRAQRQGATALALCPKSPALPAPAALSAAFSAATYPHRP